MAKYYKGHTSRLRNPGKASKVSSFNPSFNIPGWFDGFFDNFRYKIGNYQTIIAGIIVGLFIAFLIILIVDFYKVKALADFQPNITTKIYDKNNVLISELFRQKREIVVKDKIPQNLLKSFISIEDREFYEHYGINIKGIVRAFFINIFSGRIKQGGSTITQQLAKILLTSRRRSLYRKIKEACIAIMIEAYYTKDQIIELYLNQIFLGHGTYGIESASQLYFRKHVWELNLAECAILASLPSAPNRLSPIRHPKRSMERHKIVLSKMVEEGHITIPQAENAYNEFWPDYLVYINEIPPYMNTWSSRIDRAPWFTEHIRRKLIKKYGAETVYKNGLNVYTTLDVDKQAAAQEKLREALDKQTTVSNRLSFKNEDYITDNYFHNIELLSLLFDIKKFTKHGSRQNRKINDRLQATVIDELEGINYVVGLSNIDRLLDSYKAQYFKDKDFQKVEGCIISIDHRNGYIEAMVGGGEFSSTNQLNRTIQSRRQPGSSIKPLLYAAAMESGKFTPATAVLDSPIVYLDNEGGDWIPENYEGEYYGLVRLRRALAKSINVISINIAETLKIDYVTKYFAKLLKIEKKSIKKRIPRNFSIALGSLEVSPLELTRAYAIIANGGKDVIPFTIRYVKDRNGKILENREDEVNAILKREQEKGTIQIIKPATAQIMISLMRTVISAGTGAGASIGRPAAGKTGTTNNWKDAWFVGFTPQLTTGIWVGFDKLGLSLGIGQAGGSIAAPIWSRYMRAAMKPEKVMSFPTYASLAKQGICKRSGLLPASYCSTVEEFFIPGSIPEKSCDICENVEHNIEVTTKGPTENISRDQKKRILNNISNKKESGKSILNNIGNDLLD